MCNTNKVREKHRRQKARNKRVDNLIRTRKLNDTMWILLKKFFITRLLKYLGGSNNCGWN